MIEIPRDKLTLMMEAGYVYLGTRRYKEAEHMFQGISVLAPDSEVPLVALGSVAFCQGNFASAISNYKKALKLDPESLFAKIYLAESLFFSGEQDEALKYILEVGKKDPRGAAGDFARALKDAIDKGFSPKILESGITGKGKENVKSKRTHKIRS